MKVFTFPLISLVLFLTSCDRRDKPNNMILDICGREEVVSPTAEFLKDTVMSLDVSGDAYLILNAPDGKFMQCSGDQRVGFHLEYQDGSVDEHYQAVRGDLEAETIILKLSQYAEGNLEWKAGIEWKRITW
jgi:hypothetical protein